MKKTYKSFATGFGVVIELHGERKSCIFEKDIVTPAGHRGVSYTTEDKEVQAALEAAPEFNRSLFPSFWTDDVEPEATAEEKPAKRGRKAKEE